MGPFSAEQNRWGHWVIVDASRPDWRVVHSASRQRAELLVERLNDPTYEPPRLPPAEREIVLPDLQPEPTAVSAGGRSGRGARRRSAVS